MMKIVFNAGKKPRKKVGNFNIPEQRDDFTHAAHDLYSFLISKNKIIVKDCNDRIRFSPTIQEARLENPDRTYNFEYCYTYDWLTEYDNLQKLLSNPYKVTGRYKILDYDEIKRKGFLIISKQVLFGRMFKGQRILHMLYSKKKTFPKGAMLVPQKPNDVIIRYDNFQNRIRLEGPNSHPTWHNFTT